MTQIQEPVSSPAAPPLPPTHPADRHWPTTNAALNGPFTPWGEETEAYDLPVIGAIPQDLVGALFRVSSNPRFQPKDLERYHWFEGDGMVIGVYLRDGKAAFRSSWVKTDTFKVEEKAGEALYAGFVNGGPQGELPDDAPLYKNIANTNAGIFDDHLLVYYENGLPYALNPQSLETIGEWDFHGGIDTACTAHFKIDPVTGDMLFFSAVANIVTWYVADAKTGQVKDTHSFTTDIPPFLHDFAVTPNYAVFFVTPTQFRMQNALVGLPSVLWDPEALPNGTYIILMDRKTHHITRYDTGNVGSPGHFVNAHESGDEVVIHCDKANRMGTPKDRIDSPLQFHQFAEGGASWEYRVNTTTGKIHERQVHEVGGGLPRINDFYLGQKQRYGWFTTMKQLGRHDYLADRTELIAGPPPLTFSSEAVFVPRESRKSEDDGYLLSLWWDPSTGLTDLLIHEASAPSELPIAQVKLPARVPAGFHGNWADQATIEASVAALKNG